MYSYPPSLLVAVLSVLPFAFGDATPLVVPWNTAHSYGPDGPWPVVQVQVGNSDAEGNHPLSTVDLYPGGIWESMILRYSFCNDNGSRVAKNLSQSCLAKKAGLYSPDDSKTAQHGFTDSPGLIWQWQSQEAEVVNGTAVEVLDTMRIPTLDDTFPVDNSTISAVAGWQIELPDGTNYSAQVGTLSLGGPGPGIQNFSSATGQTIPGYAYAQNKIPSNSWGLHYGSASLNQNGSLVFGGYDQSRVLGDVGAFDLAADSTMLPNLLDIQIGVENGSSPFGETSYVNLLKLNASFDGVQPAVINPIVPYMFMSPETCAAVAENLPVTLNSRLGLYIWNVTDPQYERIVKSSAYLALIFQKAESGNLTIKVSFQLLNLTLEDPIVTPSQQYLPCRPFHALDGSGRYFLGKAFLQAAFIGMNWQEEKFFLAQAPGPGVGASNIRPIQTNDTTINSDPSENFATTWARNWEAISDNTTSNGTSPTNGQNEPPASGMSSGTKAGIAVGVVVGVLAVAGAVVLFRMRRRRTGMPPQEIVVPRKSNIFVHEKDGVATIPEIGEGLRIEADEGHEIHELAVRENL